MKKLIRISVLLFVFTVPAYAQTHGDMTDAQKPQKTEAMPTGEGHQMMPMMGECPQMMRQEMMQMMMDMMDMQEKILAEPDASGKKQMMHDMAQMKEKMRNMMSMHKGMMKMDDSASKLTCAEEWLKKAIDLHEAQMNDGKTAHDASQMELMDLMKKAHECITAAGPQDHGAHAAPADAVGKSSLYEQYAALKGDDYDRMFLADMIEHHQGAVDMAALALKRASHQKVKHMAEGIIAAQRKEIDEMKTWQKSFGYPASFGEAMADHSAMGMAGSMSAMTEQLKDKTGREFDALFLSLMIEHHQSAVDMAAPGEANAKHREVKRLARAIVDEQSREIAQMKQWQRDWGFEKQ